MDIEAGSKVLIGMTGGLASTVAAFLLKQQGVQVLALAQQFFPQEQGGVPCHVENLEQVKSVCDQLEIPLYATDVREEFEAQVLVQVAAARLEGRFFSTCIECQRIKLRTLQQKAKKLDCQFIATGHLAKIRPNISTQAMEIYACDDEAWDQSHLFGRVAQEDLKNLILPLANLSSKAIEGLAQQHQLKYFMRKQRGESCFFYAPYILHYMASEIPHSLKKPALFFDSAEQIYLGHNDDGMHSVHLGLKGVKSADKKRKINKGLVVTDISLEWEKVSLGDKSELNRKRLKVERLNFKQCLDRSKPRYLGVKFEDGKYYQAIIFFKNNNSALVELAESAYNKGKGHVVTFYENAKVLGSGIVGLDF